MHFWGLFFVVISTFAMASATEPPVSKTEMNCFSMHGDWSGYCSLENLKYESTISIQQSGCEKIHLNYNTYQRNKILAQVFDSDSPHVSSAQNSAIQWGKEGKKLVVTDIFYVLFHDKEEIKESDYVNIENSVLEMEGEMLRLRNQYFRVLFDGENILPSDKVYKQFTCLYSQSAKSKGGKQ